MQLLFRKVKLMICGVFILMSFQLSAQLTDQFSMHMLNKYDFNPAYAGMDFSLSANIIYRNQWEGLPGSPRNFQVNAHMPFYIWNGAIGGLIERKSTGAIAVTKAMGSYNFVGSTPYGLYSIGGRLGISTLSLDGEAIITPEGEYNTGIVHNDPILLENLDRGIGFTYDIGAYFYSRAFEGGIAISHLPTSTISLDRADISQITNANAYIQYNSKINEEISLTHSLLIKSDLDVVQSELSSLAKINGNIFGGIGVRGYSSTSIDAFSLIVGMKINKKYTLSYSYDFGVSNLRIGHEGSHEVMLNYNLQKFIGTGQPPKIIYNPRYL